MVKILIAVIVLFSALTFMLPAIKQTDDSCYGIPSSKLKAFGIIKKSECTKRILSRHYDLLTNGDEKNFLLTAYTQKPVVSEGMEYTSAYRLKDSVFIKRVYDVRKDIDLFFETRSVDTAATIINKYDVGYIYLEPSDSIKFDLSKITEKIFDENRFVVLITNKQ